MLFYTFFNSARLMELSAPDNFKAILVRNSLELESTFKSNFEDIEELYVLLVHGFIEELDNRLNTWYSVSLEKRKAIYNSFLNDLKLKKGEE